MFELGEYEQSKYPRFTNPCAFKITDRHWTAPGSRRRNII